MTTYPALTQMPIPSQARRGRWVRRTVAGAAAVAVVGAVSFVVATTDTAAAGYRTATVSTNEIAETIHEVGVIEPVSQAEATFSAGGVVKSVAVAVGDVVEVGTPLATLDARSLEADLNTARANLDQAELTLQRALDGETVEPSAGGSTDIAFASMTTGSDATTSARISTLRAKPAAEPVEPAESGDAGLESARRAVLEAQSAVSDAITASAAALGSAQEICAAATAPEGQEASPEALNACRDALADVLAAQEVTAAAQGSLADAAAHLDSLLEERAMEPGDTTTTAPTTPPTTSRPTTPGASGADPSAGAPSNGTTPNANPSSATPPTGSDAPSGGSTLDTTQSPSSEDLIAYQAAVDAAEVDIEVAEQAVRQATIRSPIAGTVTSVAVAPGDDVEAGAGVVTVVGEGGYEITATVTVDDVTEFEVGQAVAIDPDGAAALANGQIVAIGHATSSDTAATTYDVTVGVEGDADLRNGSIASLAIAVESTSDALTVPTSAVHSENGRRTVTVLADGEPVETEVTIGAVGATWTEIRSGLDLGQTVVIADLAEPLPGSATDGDGQTGTAGGGQIPGGGGFPAGGGLPSGGRFPPGS